MKIATKLKSLIVSLGLMAGGVYAAGIPVIDGTSKIQNAQEIMAMVKEYERTAERWIEELNNFESQMGNISGVRELGDLVNTAQRLRQQMERLKGKYDALKNLAENPLEGAAAALMESLRVYDNCGILKDHGPANQTGCIILRVGNLAD
jgi:HAMP domain-containing protein